MQIKLLTIAAALALAFAGVAQAQYTQPGASDKPRIGARVEGTPDVKPSVDRKARKAEHDRSEADYKAAQAKCGPMKGHDKDICGGDAKGKEKVTKAEL